MVRAFTRFPAWILATSLACGSLSVLAQNPVAPESRPGIDNYRPADYERLLEEAQLDIQNRNFTSARQSVSDALQIIKANHGLLSNQQFPALEMLASVYQEQQDWQGLDQHLAYFEWLLNKLALNDLDATLAGIEILSRIYLRVAADNNSQNAHYLIAAKQLNWRTATMLELHYGRQDLRLAPWYYNIVLTHYYQSALTRRRGMTSYDFKSNTPEIVSGWSLSKNESLEQSYSIGLELLQRIRDLYANSSQASPITDALLTLHLADWEQLFGHRQSANALYAQAYRELSRNEAGAETVRDWFTHPTVIPQPVLITTLARREDALASARSPSSSLSPVSTLTIVGWSPVFPGAPLPASLTTTGPAGDTAYSALVRFALDTNRLQQDPLENERLVPFRLAVSNVIVESAVPANAMVENLARQHISQLQFRPILLPDVLTPDVNLQLRYVFPAQTDFSMLSDAN